MQIRKLTTSLAAGCLVALAALFATIPAQAQAQAQDDSVIIEVLTAGVQPGAEADFEEFVRAYRQASKEQGLENYWLSAQSISGDPVYRFHVQHSNWGSLSNPEPQLTEAFGEREAERLLGLLRNSATSLDVAFYRQFESMSYVPANGFAQEPEGLIYIDFALQPGTDANFGEIAMKQKEASSALYPDAYFVVGMPDFGASGPRTLLILQSFSDLDRPSLDPGTRLVRHFGEQEGGRLLELAGQTIASFTNTLFRTRPDLNYQPDE